MAALPRCRSFSSAQSGQRTGNPSCHVADTPWGAPAPPQAPPPFRLCSRSARASPSGCHAWGSKVMARREVPLGSLAAWLSLRWTLETAEVALPLFRLRRAGGRGKHRRQPLCHCWGSHCCQGPGGGRAADPVDCRVPCKEKTPPLAPAPTPDWPFLPKGRPVVPWPASQL